MRVADCALPLVPDGTVPDLRVLAVAGTAMNSGKTTAAAHLTHGLKRLGERPAFAKVTGTGPAATRFCWPMRARRPC